MIEHNERFDMHSVDEQFEHYARTPVDQPTTPAILAVQSLVQIYAHQTAHEQETLERLRQRLAHAAASARQAEDASETKIIQSGRGTSSLRPPRAVGDPSVHLVRSVPTMTPRTRRGQRIGGLLQGLVAVLLVGLLIGGFVTLLLYQKSIQSAYQFQHGWQVVATPSLSGKSGSLFRVSAVSADDIWALGVSYPDNSSSQGTLLIEHWNGTRWSLVQFPSSGFKASFSGIAAVSRDDVWVVGSTTGNQSQPLIEHWDGVRWSIVDTHLRAFTGGLTAVTARAAHDVWAVGAGSSQDGSVPRQTPLFLHWDGQQWHVASQAALPTEMDQPNLAGVTAVAVDDAWAIGEAIFNQKPMQLIEHWNGRQWRQVQASSLGSQASSLNSLAAFSANDVWVLGQSWEDPNLSTVKPLIEHWDGAQWRIMPNPPDLVNYLSDITVRAANEVWVVGSTSGGKSGQVSVTLVERWDGKTWSVVPSANASTQCQNELFGLTTVPGSDMLWAVGYYVEKGCTGSANSPKLPLVPLIEVYVP
jgi:hypothetical protein